MPRSRKRISRKRKHTQKHKRILKCKQRGGWTPEEFISLPDLGTIYDELHTLLQPRPDSIIHEPIPNLDQFAIFAHGQIITPEEKEYPDFRCDTGSPQDGLSEAYKSSYAGGSYLHVNGHVVNEKGLMDCAQGLFLDTFNALYIPLNLIDNQPFGYPPSYMVSFNRHNKWIPPYLLHRIYKTLLPTKEKQNAAITIMKSYLQGHSRQNFLPFIFKAPGIRGAVSTICTSANSTMLSNEVFNDIIMSDQYPLEPVISDNDPFDTPVAVLKKVKESNDLFKILIQDTPIPATTTPLKASLEAQPNPVRALLIVITAAYLRVKMIEEKYESIHSRNDEQVAKFAARGWSPTHSEKMTDPAYEALVMKTINDYTRICYGLNALFHQVLREKLDGLFTSIGL
jgi:hypothetical protein